MAKSSEGSAVSDEDRKTLRNLDNEIAGRIKEFTNIMSKYVKVDIDIEAHSGFGYSRKAGKKVEGEVCYAYEIVEDSTPIGCYDDCKGMCYPGPCRP